MAASLREDLLASIAEWSQGVDGALSGDTPLVSSGRLDSFNLLRLLLWVEAALGEPVDATKVDLAVEWDTVDLVVAYVEHRRLG